MFNKILTLLIISVFIFTSCKKDDPAPPVKANRTVLIYMAADNSLGDYQFDKTNIESIINGSTREALNGGNLLVYIDSRHSDPQLLHITPSGKEVLRDYPEHSNSVSPQTMREVIQEVKSLFPADSYGLILWSHGSDWFPSNKATTRAFGQDQSNWMELSELKSALPDHGFDFIFFDACYMGGIEITYELKDKAAYMLASPTEIMGSGYPYQKIINYLFTPTPAYQSICDEFYNYYVKESATPYATLALLDLGKMEAIAQAVHPIIQEHYNKTDSIELNDLQHFFRSKYYGMYDFDDYISCLISTESEQYKAFRQALNDAVIYEKHTSSFLPNYGGYKITRFCGLSCFVMKEEEKVQGINDEYAKLDWYQAVYK